jgi:hypothetical protein
MPGNAQDELKVFFESSTVASLATAPLSTGVAVNISFTDGAPPCHFLKLKGGATVKPGEHPDPDFALVMPPASAFKLAALKSNDPGDFGVEFFQLCISNNPDEKILVRVNAGALRLLSHGYLGVVGVGGRKMLGWMRERGVLGLSGFKAAISRMREQQPK